MRAHIDVPVTSSVTCPGSRWKRGSEEKATWLTLVVSNLFDSGTSNPSSQEAKKCIRWKKQATICCFTDPCANLRHQLCGGSNPAQRFCTCLTAYFFFLRQVFNDRSMSEESFHVMDQLTQASVASAGSLHAKEFVVVALLVEGPKCACEHRF